MKPKIKRPKHGATCSTLSANPANPRDITDEQREMLEKSLEAFGDLSGIVYNRRTKRLVGGHRRKESFEKIDDFPITITQRYSKPTKKGTVAEGFIEYDGERFTYREVDWSAEDESVAMIAANKQGGTFNDKLVADLLADMDNGAIDMALTGFGSAELEEIMTRVGKDPEEIPDADPKFEKVKELQEQWQVQTGQVWQVGEGRLMCGSSLEEAHVDRLLEGQLIDLIVTSPPYNIKLNKMRVDGKQIGTKNWLHKMSEAYFDAMPEEEYQAQQTQLCNLLLKKCAPTASFFYNHKIRYRDKIILSPLAWLQNVQWNIRQEIIWSRKSATTIIDGMFMLTDERIYWLSQKEFYFDNKPEIKAWSTVWEIAPKPECDFASAPYPNELPKRCVMACSKPGQLVFDPYMGSGTTLIVADGLGRKCYGMEINPSYCAVILQRYVDATGKKPFLIE